MTELDEEALVARAQAQFVRAAATAQRRGLGQEAAADTAAAHASTPNGITSTLEGDGSAAPRIEGEQGAGLHGSASCDGCACHIAGLALELWPQTVHKFAQYLQCVRRDTPLGELPEYLVEGAVRDARHHACLSRFRYACH